MSSTLKNIYGATPATTRGKSVLLGGDPKGNNFVYTNGSAVFMRNLKNPLLTEMYTEHSHQTTVARYAPSGFYIASGDVSGTVRIWDTTQKEHILKLELRVLGGPILDLQWSDDSKRIIAVGEGKERFGAVFLWDSGSSVGEISGHAKTITSCDFKQTRPYRVATGGEDFQVNWFEGPPFKFKKSFKEHSRFVNCVRFSPDGNKLLTVSSDKTGFFYDGKSGDLVGKLNPDHAHSAGIYACAWSPDSKRVLTASADKTCKIWDAESGNCLTTFNVSPNPQVEDQQVGCLWQGDELISVALSGDIVYLDPSNPNQPKKVVRGHQKFITALAYDHQNNYFYSGSYDSVIVRWDIQGNTEPMVGKGHSNQINRLFVHGNHLVSCAKDDTIRLTPLNSRQYSGDAIAVDSEPLDIAVGRNSNLIVAVLLGGSIVVIRDGKVANKIATKYQPSAVAISVDETVVAVGAKDNSIHLYQVNGTNLTEGTVLSGHRGPISALTFSPDGKYLGSADNNRDIFVFDHRSGELKIQGWCFHTARVNSLAWSPDSLHLVSSSLDSHLYVWSVQEPGKRIQIKDAHRGGANTAFFVDNNTIISAGQDCTVKTWTVNHH